MLRTRNSTIALARVMQSVLGLRARRLVGTRGLLEFRVPPGFSVAHTSEGTRLCCWGRGKEASLIKDKCRPVLFYGANPSFSSNFFGCHDRVSVLVGLLVGSAFALCRAGISPSLWHGVG